MDPISAVGAVASIITLAQTAISLSTTLYTVGGALLSASEDLKSLADDLKTFSQSLTLLGRLLEDSKSWYSDDIYLLMAKVIKDCANLYAKIDGILSNLGSKGKDSWIKKMKFVMKESQIRKLLSRLRDLKGTLATILMSLQVDLQLSLLNISSSSKLQRAPEVSLQLNTVKTLIEAQEAVKNTRFLSIQSTKSGAYIPMQRDVTEKIRPGDGARNPITQQTYSNSIIMFQQVSDLEKIVPEFGHISHRPRSLRSSLSSDSFKSAVDEQEPDMVIVREVESILHAFRTALKVLQEVVTRIHEEDKPLRFKADMLDLSLRKGLDIGRVHRSYYEKHGHAYLEAFQNPENHPLQLQDITAELMRELVATLHMYGAEYEVLSPKGFEWLYTCSEKCRIKALFELDRIVMLLLPAPLILKLRTDDAGIFPESIPLQGPGSEIYVTEKDVDDRVTADHDRLRRRSWYFASLEGFGVVSNDIAQKVAHRDPATELRAQLSSGDSYALQGHETRDYQKREGILKARRAPGVSDGMSWDDQNSQGPIRQLSQSMRAGPNENQKLTGSTNMLHGESLTTSIYPRKPQYLDESPGGQTEQPGAHNEYARTTKKDFDRDQNIKYFASPIVYKCQFPQCPYESKRESNCREHMEKSHSWKYARSKNNGKNPIKDMEPTLPSPQTSNHGAPGSNSFSKPTLEEHYKMDITSPASHFSSPGYEIAMLYTPTCKAVIDESFEHYDSGEQELEEDFRTVPNANANILAESGYHSISFIGGGPSSATNELQKGEYTTETDSKEERKSPAKSDNSNSKVQPPRLWLQAHMAVRNSESTLIRLLDSVLGSELGIDMNDLESFGISRSNLASSPILRLLETLKPIDNQIAELEKAKLNRENIIQVIEAVSGTIGLDISALAWSCVVVSLKIYEPYFKSTPSSLPEVSTLRYFDLIPTVFSQLSDIVSIIARYTVMENLYSQTPTMTLRSDYRSSLVGLCSKILLWFANTFRLFKFIEDDSTEISAQEELSNLLWKEIKKLDAACQKFTVIVEVTPNYEEMSENELDIEEISDDDLDEIIETEEAQDREVDYIMAVQDPSAC